MKENQIPVKEIVRRYLIKYGYDGLYSDAGQCGCGLADLMCCEMPGTDCEPGYKVGDPTGEFVYRIVPEKEESYEMED